MSGFLESLLPRRRPKSEPKEGPQPITPDTGLEPANFNPLPLNPLNLYKAALPKIMKAVPDSAKKAAIEQYQRLLKSADPLIRDATRKHLERMKAEMAAASKAKVREVSFGQQGPTTQPPQNPSQKPAQESAQKAAQVSAQKEPPPVITKPEFPNLGSTGTTNTKEGITRPKTAFDYSKK